MKTWRVHIAGASGEGVTTLGRALADAALSHQDTDDYYWLPTSPPYQHTSAHRRTATADG